MNIFYGQDNELTGDLDLFLLLFCTDHVHMTLGSFKGQNKT